MATIDTAEKLRKVQRYSTSLERLFKLLFALSAISLVIGAVLMAFGPGRMETPILIGNRDYSGDSVTGTIRLLAFFGFGLRVGILLKFNFHLFRLFGLYAKGSIFTAGNVHQIRQIGITVLLIPALWIVEMIVPVLVGDGGQISTVTAVQSNPFTEVVAGTIIIVISWIMDVGRELREEQDLVV